MSVVKNNAHVFSRKNYRSYIDRSIVRVWQSKSDCYSFYNTYIFQLDRKRGIMSTEHKNRLHQSVTVPEMDIPLSLLFDLKNFARDKMEDAKIEVDLLKTASNSEHLLRQPVDSISGINAAQKDADFERYHWWSMYSRLSKLCVKALNE